MYGAAEYTVLFTVTSLLEPRSDGDVLTPVIVPLPPVTQPGIFMIY